MNTMDLLIPNNATNVMTTVMNVVNNAGTEIVTMSVPTVKNHYTWTLTATVLKNAHPDTTTPTIQSMHARHVSTHA
jgi:hypothetical protein